MSTPHADVDDTDRLARVKLSSAIEPGDLRVTGLVGELGAVKVLDDLEAAGEVENHWGFTIGHELAHVDPGKVLEQAGARGIRFVIPGDAEWPDRLAGLRGAGAPDQHEPNVAVGSPRVVLGRVGGNNVTHSVVSSSAGTHSSTVAQRPGRSCAT